MTRNILLTAQGTACAVNCGACLLHVVLISATDTPRNLYRIKKKKITRGKIYLNNEMGLKKFSQDRKQDEMLFCFGIFSR